MVPQYGGAVHDDASSSFKARHGVVQDANGRVGKESGSVEVSASGIFGDPIEERFGQGDVDPDHALLAHGRRDEKGHRIGVEGIGHHGFQARRLGKRLAILPHAFYMKGQGLAGHFLGFIQGPSRRDATGEVGKIHAKVGSCLLPHESDVVGHRVTST